MLWRTSTHRRPQRSLGEVALRRCGRRGLPEQGVAGPHVACYLGWRG
jgi:hypothetical protein